MCYPFVTRLTLVEGKRELSRRSRRQIHGARKANIFQIYQLADPQTFGNAIKTTEALLQKFPVHRTHPTNRVNEKSDTPLPPPLRHSAQKILETRSDKM